MELAQHSQEAQPLEEQRTEQPAGAQGEQPRSTTAQPEPTTPRLTAVPDPAEEQRGAAEEEPPRAPRRAQPPKAAQGTRAESAPEADRPEDEAGTSPHQLRRYRTRWNSAKTAEERAAALRYGVERGIPEAVELMQLLQGEKPSTTPGDAPTPPAPTNAPPKPADAAGPAQPAAAPQPAPPPAEPRIMGQPRTAVAAHAEQAKWFADLTEGLGKLVGWEAPPSAPMDLFEGIPGVEPLKGVQGNPRKRLAELVAVELASMSAKAGGEQQDSPLRRRAEIGMLVLGTAGPGLLPFAARLAGAGMSKLTVVSNALAGLVRRWRR